MIRIVTKPGDPSLPVSFPRGREEGPQAWPLHSCPPHQALTPQPRASSVPLPAGSRLPPNLQVPLLQLSSFTGSPLLLFFLHSQKVAKSNYIIRLSQKSVR